VCVCLQPHTISRSVRAFMHGTLAHVCAVLPACALLPSPPLLLLLCCCCRCCYYCHVHPLPSGARSDPAPGCQSMLPCLRRGAAGMGPDLAASSLPHCHGRLPSFLPVRSGSSAHLQLTAGDRRCPGSISDSAVGSDGSYDDDDDDNDDDDGGGSGGGGDGDDDGDSVWAP
jgi:hypothetical protein